MLTNDYSYVVICFICISNSSVCVSSFGESYLYVFKYFNHDIYYNANDLYNITQQFV